MVWADVCLMAPFPPKHKLLATGFEAEGATNRQVQKYLAPASPKPQEDDVLGGSGRLRLLKSDVVNI